MCDESVLTWLQVLVVYSQSCRN